MPEQNPTKVANHNLQNDVRSKKNVGMALLILFLYISYLHCHPTPSFYGFSYCYPYIPLYVWKTFGVFAYDNNYCSMNTHICM